MVPFSTGGIGKLKSFVTKGRLLDAVKLPLPPSEDGLEPVLIPVTGFDPVPAVPPKPENSVKQIDIDFENVPTSIYNWEVFFHNPLLVATQLR